MVASAGATAAAGAAAGATAAAAAAAGAAAAAAAGTAANPVCAMNRGYEVLTTSCARGGKGSGCDAVSARTEDKDPVKLCFCAFRFGTIRRWCSEDSWD